MIIRLVAEDLHAFGVTYYGKHRYASNNYAFNKWINVIAEC